MSSTDDKLDGVWKALADPTRREILDLLSEGPRTTTKIVDRFEGRLSRFGVMKHLETLRQAELVISRREGRKRINAINAVPLRRIYERWVSKFADLWSGELLRIEEDLADGRDEA